VAFSDSNAFPVIGFNQQSSDGLNCLSYYVFTSANNIGIMVLLLFVVEIAVVVLIFLQ